MASRPLAMRLRSPHVRDDWIKPIIITEQYYVGGDLRMRISPSRSPLNLAGVDHAELSRQRGALVTRWVGLPAAQKLNIDRALRVL